VRRALRERILPDAAPTAAEQMAQGGTTLVYRVALAAGDVYLRPLDRRIDKHVDVARRGPA
jgi:hypothetical protein